MQYTLITNQKIKNENYLVKTFAQFIDEASSDEGISFDGDFFYVDVASLEDEKIYEEIAGAGLAIKWLLLEGDVPEWFTAEIERTPKDLDEAELKDEDVSVLSEAIAFLDKEPSEASEDEKEKVGTIITFGSAKGGAGKSFTSMITAYRYAVEHPSEKIAFLDLDIIEPQISAILRCLNKSIKPYYLSYKQGKDDFSELEKCKYNHRGMPENLDFYLNQKEQHPIDDTTFWETVMTRLFYNYDMVFLDTGTEYLEIPAIITAYKVADRINLVCMPNITSSVVVSRQIKNLTGETQNAHYKPEDELRDKINLVFTNYNDNNITNAIVEGMGDKCPIVARFGYLSPKIDEVEILNKWNYFDDNEGFCQGVKALWGEA